MWPPGAARGEFDPWTDTPGKFLVPHSICVDPRDHIWNVRQGEGRGACV